MIVRVIYFSGQDANSDNHDRKDVREIFEPVVSQVLELISKQVIEVLKSGKGPVAVNPLPPAPITEHTFMTNICFLMIDNS